MLGANERPRLQLSHLGISGEVDRRQRRQIRGFVEDFGFYECDQVTEQRQRDQLMQVSEHVILQSAKQSVAIDHVNVNSNENCLNTGSDDTMIGGVA